MRLLALIVLLLPAPALACGGFFCSSINLEPIQQNAERILFEVPGDGTVTATVEIRYQGDPDDFSWVVPVPTELGADDIDVEAPANALLLLEDATRPQVIPPPTECRSGGFDSPMGVSRAGGGNFDDAESDGGVDVTELPVVGPYAPTMLQATDADALIAWLNEHDYLITREMEPLVAEYVAGGMWFLALKLTPESAVDDISPISFRYASDVPVVPIQLTGVAAEPEMGILTFVASDSIFESQNFTNLQLSTDEVQANPANGQTNYYPLLSWKLDEAGGQAVVTQFAGGMSTPIQDAENRWSWNDDYSDSIAYLRTLDAQYSQLTRLYSRMSAWEMTLDPMFVPGGNSVSSIIDLSDRDPVDVCGPNSGNRVPCGDMYCGADAQCGTTDSGEGCLCPDGFVGRRISAPSIAGGSLVETIVCDKLDSEMMGSIGELGFDPDAACATLACGPYGSCESLNGFPTCSCDEGYAAVLWGDFLRCERAEKVYDADQLLWAGACQDCSTGGRAQVGWLGLLLLGLRRRRS